MQAGWLVRRGPGMRVHVLLRLRRRAFSSSPAPSVTAQHSTGAVSYTAISTSKRVGKKPARKKKERRRLHLIQKEKPNLESRRRQWTRIAEVYEAIVAAREENKNPTQLCWSLTRKKLFCGGEGCGISFPFFTSHAAGLYTRAGVCICG